MDTSAEERHGHHYSTPVTVRAWMTPLGDLRLRITPVTETDLPRWRQLLGSLPAVDNVDVEGAGAGAATFAVAATQPTQVIAQLRRTGTLDGSETGNTTTGEMTLRFRSVTLPGVAWPATSTTAPPPARAPRPAQTPMVAAQAPARMTAPSAQARPAAQPARRAPAATPAPARVEAAAVSRPPVQWQPAPTAAVPVKAATQRPSVPADLRPQPRMDAPRPPRTDEPLHVAAERIRSSLASVQQSRDSWRQAFDNVVERLDELAPRPRPEPLAQPRAGSLRDAFPKMRAVPRPQGGSA
jgi:hypothetical protein